MDYKKKIEKLVNNLKIDNKVAWIYQNNGFIDIEVGEHAYILVNKLKKYVK
jgi:hypothetical protein